MAHGCLQKMEKEIQLKPNFSYGQNSFSYTRYSTRDYKDGFIEDNPNYPCLPDYKAEMICVNFDELPLGAIYKRLKLGGLNIDSDWEFSISDAHALMDDTSIVITFLTFLTFPEPVCWLNIDAYKSGGQDVVFMFLNEDGDILGIKNPPLNKGRINISFGEEDCADASCKIKRVVNKK